jgi:hypothetical protein
MGSDYNAFAGAGQSGYVVAIITFFVIPDAR